MRDLLFTAFLTGWAMLSGLLLFSIFSETRRLLRNRKASRCPVCRKVIDLRYASTIRDGNGLMHLDCWEAT